MRGVCSVLATSLVAVSAFAQLMISGNEAKIDLTSGTPRGIAGAPPDSLTILDFDTFPPTVRHIDNIKNTVIGPPSNIAITPDESLALVASSVVLDPKDPAKWVPDSVIHVLDLRTDPPSVVQELATDKQPSGMSITRDGKRAIVANRAAGTVSLLAIDGTTVSIKQTLEVCKPEDNISDVAITPDGKTALASVCEAGYMAMLHIEGDALTLDERKFSVCGKPYRVVISPDGRFALTGGSGQGVPDVDAVTVVDLSLNPPRTVDYVLIPPGPESLEISPDGKLVAVVIMAGSNLPADKPLHTEQGIVVLLARRENTFVKVQEIPTGPIPEGVAFSPDGKYLVVQCHPKRELWFFEVVGETLRDTGQRIGVPAMPSSLRIADKP
ncbi:MAG: hypothetical protein K1Y02_21260 [Candidatus Hydrogenedentes bacterium]|nr:hypothetical protein [Candidatus Hydrogenedentota bacterium]